MSGRQIPPPDPAGIDLWYVRTDQTEDSRLLAAYEALLTEEERRHAARYRVARTRHEHLVTRALVRTVLSAYAPEIEPGEWRFSANRFGKPRVDGPRELPLRFNLSHTPGLIVCAARVGGDIGVDVEALGRRRQHAGLARRFFAPSEAEAIEAAPTTEQPERFIDYWTLKESFIKALGEGLAIPLSEFAFSLDGSRPARLHFDHPEWGRAEEWRFARIQLGHGYRIAVALRPPVSQPLQVCLRPTIPMVAQSEPTLLSRSTVDAWRVLE